MRILWTLWFLVFALLFTAVQCGMGTPLPQPAEMVPCPACKILIDFQAPAYEPPARPITKRIDCNLPVTVDRWRGQCSQRT